MNVVLLVVDSLRACSLGMFGGDGARTPFLEHWSSQTTCFRRAYATECWTLPTHCSIFTGQLPSAHGAHFQTMGYAQPSSTIAEILSRAGFHTEIVTRNFIFDGTIPGVTRGFQANRRLLSDVSRITPFGLFLGLAKPRFRRHVKHTGFFHPFHRDNARFLTTFARALLPADRRALDYIVESMRSLHRKGQPYLFFCNLYDVHAPYPPRPDSILRSFGSTRGVLENLAFPSVMAKLGAHRYLRPGFRMSERNRRMLLQRYHTAIELMDGKLADFVAAARTHGLLDDTLLVVTSDHGEAFGDHGLYLHDASVYNTHLHVPLWIHHPTLSPHLVDDVVSTRDLFGLMQAAALGSSVDGTILDSGYRAGRPLAIAEHFHYPRLSDAEPRYRRNLLAVTAGSAKVVARNGLLELCDPTRDPGEMNPRVVLIDDIETEWRRLRIPVESANGALEHLRRWREAHPSA